MSELHINGVSKNYGSVQALQDINIKINSGEFLVLIGPSGCGKSTLMNSIAGLDNISQGHIEIGGRDVTNLPPKDRDIAMVFQSYALYPSMTVYQNIAFGLEIRKVQKKQIDKEVHRVSRMLKIEHLLDRKPAALSGGQRQRVAMGRALAREPKIFLFDEPLSNLDAKLRVQMRTEIKKLHQRVNSTIVYVTHDQIEAMTLADRIAVIKDGMLLQLGSPDEIYNNPVNLFVAGFMGSPAMNFLRCTLIRKDTLEYGLEVQTNSGQTYVLPMNDESNLEKYVNHTVVLGLRPEQITLADSSDSSPIVQSRIDVLEPTGADTLILTNWNEKEVTARVHPNNTLSHGDVVSFHVDLTKAILFDPETEERII
ncbi:ABC transporter ATP-binding protein [uncultured Vibrio sp.]|uniref:ABC transporter ATP-binding protein n=1 Tax=uncultured Vibrio sp. TaxID=114054 RepID=UPI0025E48131|nr:ABC transporter ATP-binding protein [uncultured Vibrio sp.]